MAVPTSLGHAEFEDTNMSYRTLILLLVLGCGQRTTEDPDANEPDAGDTPTDPDPVIRQDCFTAASELGELRTLDNNAVVDHGSIVATAVSVTAQIAVGSSDGNIKLWDAPEGYGFFDPEAGAGRPVRALCFDPMERWVAAAGANGDVFLWSVVERAAGASESIGRELRAIATSDDGSRVVTVDNASPSNVHFWTTESQELTDHATVVENGYAVTLVSESDEVIVAGVTDHHATVALYNSDGALLVRYELSDIGEPAQAVSTTSDGSKLIVGGKNFAAVIDRDSRSGDQVLADGNDGYRLTRVDHHHVIALALANSDDRVATLGSEGTLKVWDRDSLTELTSNELRDPVTLSSIPGTDRFLVGGEDGWIRFYGCAAD